MGRCIGSQAEARAHSQLGRTQLPEEHTAAEAGVASGMVAEEASGMVVEEASGTVAMVASGTAVAVQESSNPLERAADTACLGLALVASQTEGSSRLALLGLECCQVLPVAGS